MPTGVDTVAMAMDVALRNFPFSGLPSGSLRKHIAMAAMRETIAQMREWTGGDNGAGWVESHVAWFLDDFAKANDLSTPPHPPAPRERSEHGTEETK